MCGKYTLHVCDTAVKQETIQDGGIWIKKECLLWIAHSAQEDGTMGISPRASD